MIPKRKSEKIQGYFWGMLFGAVFLIVVVLPALFLWKMKGEESAKNHFATYQIDPAEDTVLSFQNSEKQNEIILSFANADAKMTDAEIACDIIGRRIYVTVPGRTNVENGILEADITCVEAAYYSESEDYTTFVFALRDYYESQVIANRQQVQILLSPISEINIPIIVIDISNASEKIEEIALLVQEELIPLDYYACIIGMEPKEQTPQQRIQFADEIGASLYLRVEMAPEEDSGEARTTAFCNADYFLPKLNSVVLADCIEYHTVERLGGEPGGVVEYQEDDIELSIATIPACTIRLGYQIDESGVCSATMPEYTKLAAQGISEGIVQALNEENGD